MGIAARFYRPLADALHTAGFGSGVVPRRGVEPGADPPSAERDWSYADEAADLSAAIRAARGDGAGPVLVLGHSLGAQLVLTMMGTVAADSAAVPDALVTVAASVPFHEDYRGGALDVGALADDVFRTTGTHGYWPTPGFGAPTPATLMREWATMVRTGWLPGAPETPADLDTLAIRLEHDALVPDSAARRFESLIAANRLTSWVYGAAHCPPGGTVDHVGWVRTPDAVVRRIVQWWGRA